MTSNTYLVWLEWPERCFRASAEDICALEKMVPSLSRVIRVRSEKAFLKALPSATHAIVWNFKKEWFSLAPRLKVLATPAAGREFVPETGPNGVKVSFGSFHGPIIAENVAAFILAWARGFFALRNAPESAGAWPRTWLSDKCTLVSGTHAVIAGFGNIGRAVAKKLSALGVSVTGITRHGSFRVSNKKKLLSEEELFSDISRADWFILALPSTTGTDGFFGRKMISRLPRKAVLINVGRGNAVDEKALYAALKTSRLAGAYLDVRRSEPSATVLHTPGFVPELSALPNCVSTPHSSAFDGRYVKMCFEELAKKGLLK